MAFTRLVYNNDDNNIPTKTTEDNDVEEDS
jgi:hypothetical protein